MSGPAENAPQFRQYEISPEKTREPRHYQIAVVGVGDAGHNTISRLMDMGITGAEFVAINTTNKESRKKVEDIASNVEVVFVVAGLGGRTGTDAAPLAAEIGRRNGAIVVGVVTMPLRTEKRKRMEYAAQGLIEMRRRCHTVVVIDNNKLRYLVPHLPLDECEAFKVADQVLADTINRMIDALSEPPLINLNSSSFKEILMKGGVAVVGVGESDAPKRADEAARNALRSPLLDLDYSGASGALIHVTGDDQMTLEEANRVREIVTEMMHKNALVSWGAKVNPSLPGIWRVTLVMTGIQSPYLPRGFSTIVTNLYDMDPQTQPEEPLQIDLDLYQLEDFE